MADFYRSHGDAGTIGTFQSFIGKTLRAVAVVVKDAGNSAVDLRTEVGVNLAVPAILQAVEGNVSVLAYQVQNTTSGQISLLLETANHLTTTDIANIVKTGGASGIYGNNSVDATGTTCTDVGFKLALS